MAFPNTDITTGNSPATTNSTTTTYSPKTSGGSIMGQSTTDLIGFYGVTAVAQQASSVDLVTQLVALGLVASGTVVQGPGSAGIVNQTTATLTVTPALHAGRVITLNRAAGVAVTLPPATGTGNTYQFVVGTTITSVGATITTGVVGASSDAFQGVALTEDGGTLTGWLAVAGAGGSDVITLNGSTTGGFVGDFIEMQDIGAGVWQVKRFLTKSTGTAATPFSHT